MDQNQSRKFGEAPFVHRKANSRTTPRKKLPWPKRRPFRILSLDGGGIRGLYAACLLRHVETEIIEGSQAAEYFDLIAGTSTGGIIAVGLGLSMSADSLVKFYEIDGKRIFPPQRYRKTKQFWEKWIRSLYRPSYDHQPLECLLCEALGDKTLGFSNARLVIPAFMVPASEIAVFKTDHHPDYRRDHKTAAWEVCRATSAAPTYFVGHERSDRMFVDGGLWANNPVLVAITEALSCFDITPSQLRILSIGTGNKPYEISLKDARGGSFQWRWAVSGAMHLATDNATSQAALLLGHNKVLRLEPKDKAARIDLDDWESAVRLLPDAAAATFLENRKRIARFFRNKVKPRNRFYSQIPPSCP